MSRLARFKHLPLAMTVAMFGLLYAVASLLYPGFFSAQVAANLLGDNAMLGIAAVGMTFVILSGGIDLSVGAMLALSTMVLARLIGEFGWPPWIAHLVVLVLGTAFGASQGYIIHRYALPPFLVTLAGMFLARGSAFIVSQESLEITHPLYTALQDFGIPLGSTAALPTTALVFLTVLAAGVVLAHHTPFGRNVYAIGGSEPSALLMGLPVGSTKIRVYALNGFCSALGGIVATLYMGSGNPAMGMGLELDAIACVVLGGTLLTGGIGTLAGTFAGVLIFGTIQTALVFDGRLNSWWLRIVVGSLLLLWCLALRVLRVQK